MKWPWSHQADSFETLIAAGAEFRGGIAAKGAVHIHGRVDGNVRCEDLLVVGRDGEVKGDVWGRVVTIGGRVLGNVEATERVDVLSTARLTGDIHSPAVSIEVGAEFEGTTHMGAPSALARPAARRGDRGSPPSGSSESVA